VYFEPPLEMLTLSLSAGATPPQSAGLLWLPRTRGELSPARPRRCMSKMTMCVTYGVRCMVATMRILPLDGISRMGHAATAS
jgi:hypothetical protein